MMTRRSVLATSAIGLAAWFGSSRLSTILAAEKTFQVTHTDAEWRKQLTAEQYEVTRRQGTERAFTGRYWNNHDAGMYRCVCCGTDLFRSDDKFGIVAHDLVHAKLNRTHAAPLRIRFRADVGGGNVDC